MAKKRRRKKRSTGPPPSRPAADVRPAVRQPSGPENRPQALWGSFPLTEIVIAIGLILLLGGLFLPPDRGKIVLGVGLVLASLAGLELAAREHFTGFRSHTSLLAGGAGVASVAIVLAIGQRDLPVWVALVIGLAVGGFAAFALVRAFRRHSGGVGIRIR